MKGAANNRQLELGAIYTPQVLADWAAQLLVRNLPKHTRGLILDPACGDGVLLQAVLRITQGHKFAGIDVDRNAVTKARHKIPGSVRLVRADALAPARGRDVAADWKQLLRHKSPIGMIANPPWGARLSHSRERLKELGYTLAQGQFDSFELFMELSLKLVASSGIMVFIVPDSIFQPGHQALRKLLSTRTSILLIARLGEGFFGNVYRGAAIVVLRNEAPSPTANTACLRLTKEWRSKILNGKCTLADAEKELTHYVPQSRFRIDPYNRFDIDLTELEKSKISLIERHVDGWTNWLESGRGVELSKSGAIVYCPRCSHAHPYPRAEHQMRCRACGHCFWPKSARSERIVLPVGKNPRDWRPFIVGEDVDRYEAIPSRYIKPNVRGINYKSDETFDSRKIVIRKTGVGIKAAIDESGALTNQVVFIYRMRRTKKGPKFLLEYFLGVLCSRVILAYYLKKRGESEWRSHPYLTQRIISELPVPNVLEGTWQWRQAQEIADAVRRRIKSNSPDSDLLVERLVAGLFEFTDSDCAWALQVLDLAQSLEPIRTLRLAEPKALYPLRIS